MNARQVALAIWFTTSLLFPNFAEAVTPEIKLSDRHFLRVDSDTLVIQFGQERIPFRPADFKNGDSLRIMLDDTTGGQVPLYLYSNYDTLKLEVNAGIIDVNLLVNTDTIVTRYLFTAIKPMSHFLGLLREYRSFAATAPLKTLDLAYPDSASAAMRALRATFNIDSIAGTGGELPHIVNLLHWVHTVVRHDGSIEVPSGWTVPQLLKRDSIAQRGVNCGVLADVMDAVFAAAGIRSRRIVCLPYDTADTECHSINAAWSADLKKWIYVDPTFEGMFYDTLGIPLSVGEVRAAMANGDSLYVNENLNWNGQQKERREYLAYLAKNLFRFAYYLPLRPDASGKVRNVRVCLNPTGYQSELLSKKADDDSTSDFTNLATDNPNSFWAAP